jgi:hypothetical protein
MLPFFAALGLFAMLLLLWLGERLADRVEPRPRSRRGLPAPRRRE